MRSGLQMPVTHGFNPMIQSGEGDSARPQQGHRNGDGGGNRDMSEADNGNTYPNAIYNPYFTGRPRTSTGTAKSESVNRQEIIRRIKGREATELNVRTLFRVLEPTREDHQSLISVQNTSPPNAYEVQPWIPHSPRKRKSPSPPSLLPSPDIAQHQESSSTVNAGWHAAGLEINRPRSALHKGDFREEQVEHPPEAQGRGQIGSQRHRLSEPLYSTSPVAPWHENFPAAALRRPQSDASVTTIPQRPRAVSHVSLSSSFSYHPPTSPLVNQANAADLPDVDGTTMRLGNYGPDKARRHTFSPRSLQQPASLSDQPAGILGRDSAHAPILKREGSFPYQAHQPRRSLSSFNSLPQTPMQRRPSNVSDGSPLQRAMVGSFEESILRGRMSSTPSKPLDFTAQIGVLGKGNCKPSLKCPQHVTVPFPAVFYSYGTDVYGGSVSPYVGLVDLENAPEMSRPQDGRKSRRQLRSTHSGQSSRAQSVTGDRVDESASASDARTRRRKQYKRKRRSQSPRLPPRGSYRIPEQGQLQIIIKNPHKTAVKLFLVPYDVSDMQPGQKTFIRQRSYSAGPIVDMPLTSRKNLGTDRPEAAIFPVDEPADRPVLRYLVHLHICCPAKGRYYLYKSMRVVFANRVPDGKEKLRNEIQLPEPRYSVYRAVERDSAGGLDAIRSAQQRRRSAVDTTGGAYDPGNFGVVPATDLDPGTAIDYDDGFAAWQAESRARAPSFRFPQLPTLDSRPASRAAGDQEEQESAISRGPISPTSPLSPLHQMSSRRFGPQSSPDGSSVGELKISFSRTSSAEHLPEVRAESLLSRRLKDLEMQGASGERSE